ncbi:MAG: sensor histidine kinase [Chloroflexi bacterium]|nr:sensor histidine kinase [Chloroflexota bacterium]MBP8058389.1 sensor histidine kinase [Chloroflexota bacterium]
MSSRLNAGLNIQAFSDTVLAEYEQVQRELREIDILVKQSAAEVERHAQRNAQVSGYVRQMEPNFETTPRADIKEAYEALLNAQQRLFTMRGQLEKLQSDQRNLDRLAQIQRQVLELLEGEDVLAHTAQKRSAPRSDASNVIRIIQTQETERQSLVRRMHDGPASSLSNFILQAEICQRFFETDPQRARVELNALKDAAAGTFGAVKDFIFDLRPMMLDDLGVVPTLRRYVESVQEKGNLPVSITVTGTERRLESHIEVTIFRAVQELLNNARNHAQATQVQVVLDIAPERVTIVVEDNGIGFNVEEAMDKNNRDTIGLSTLRDRIEMLNGELRIQSGRGRGTRAEFSVPVEADLII